MLNMSKKRKRAARLATQEAKKCPLCKKLSSTLTIHKVCPCFLGDLNYKTVLINGENCRIIKEDSLAPAREDYLKKIDLLMLSHPKAIELRRKVREKTCTKKETPLSRQARQDFYKSQEWRALRFIVLKEQGARCCLCGTTSATDIMHVDHIVPLSWDWGLRLTKNNLQILCESCNLGKKNTDATDFRNPR